MRIVDANILISASNEDEPNHADALQWLEYALNGGDIVGFTWTAMMAYMRIVTNRDLLENPMSLVEALEQIEIWTSSSSTEILVPGPDHMSILAEILSGLDIADDLINDAHLAAIAIERNADLVSYDSSYGEFPGVSWRTPTELLNLDAAHSDVWL